MADASKTNDLKFINTFQKDLERNAASGKKTGTESMSSFVKDIDTIGKASTTTTTTTATATTIEGNRTTPNTNEPQADANPTTEARHGHEICPNPLPWSPYQHFQGPMCGCRDSNWCHGGTTAHDQNETNAH
ncbi:hypothetical protein B0H65DRAFT_440185 [Neurospora tetraspora]|uniref:Uncharacterized protein n=1 Tax=Neurospora tetraspora TaxID=94610 RepID=A0AAE0MUS4_9PEZI|nr:hypothetical protein B0H65DRAFT_440185 [Neurospora tetraspora]